MENKQIVIKDYFNILRDEYGRIYCIQDIGDPKSLIKAIREQNEYIQAKEQECEELKEKVKKYGEINEQETKDYAELKAENEELIRRITKIFACLIKANRTNKIVDTLWVDNITTLWDYIALTLGIEGDQVQIEEQILQKISEVENDNK